MSEPKVQSLTTTTTPLNLSKTDDSSLLKGVHGSIVIINKDGTDGKRFPLNLSINKPCVFGRYIFVAQSY